MPVTHEVLARVEWFFDTVEQVHEAEISEETLAKTDAEIEAELSAWGIDVDAFVEDLRSRLGLEAGGGKPVAQQDRAEMYETVDGTGTKGVGTEY